MRRVHVIAAVVVVMITALTLSGCSYNRFTGSEEAIKTQWAQVQNQLQRRNDLIPNLVESVKGFAAQEKEIFTRLPLRARSWPAPEIPTRRSRRRTNSPRRSRGCSWSSRTTLS